MRQRAVGAPACAGRVRKATPAARMSCAKTAPSSSSFTLPMKPPRRRARRCRPLCWPPSRRRFQPRPHAGASVSARSASISVMPPLAMPSAASKALGMGDDIDDGTADADHVLRAWLMALAFQQGVRSDGRPPGGRLQLPHGPLRARLYSRAQGLSQRSRPPCHGSGRGREHPARLSGPGEGRAIR